MIFNISNIASNDHWLIYIIVGIISVTLIILLAIIVYRLNYLLSKSRIRKFESALLNLLSGAVNHPEKNQENKNRISKILKKRWQYEILLKYLKVMCYSFRGIFEDRSKELYMYFGLNELSERKLKSLKWDKRIEGIIELSVIGGHDSYNKILPLLDDKEIRVRRQCKIAIVELGEVNGLIEMEAKMGTMSNWTFISILSILHRSTFKISSKNLEILKKSKNPSMKKLLPHLEKYAVTYS